VCVCVCVCVYVRARVRKCYQRNNTTDLFDVVKSNLKIVLNKGIFKYILF